MMFAEFESVHNYYEQAVFRQVMEHVTQYHQFAGDIGGLADIACLALNRLPPRYIRNQVDMNFYMNKEDRAKLDAAVSASVEFAFRFMQSRASVKARKS
jgi:hypothetical protein